MISEYQRYGCDVFSIVDDLSYENIDGGLGLVRKLHIKNDNRPCKILYTGCKTSINPIKCYWANSFILQG